MTTLELPRLAPSGPSIFLIGGSLLRVTNYVTASGAQQHTCLSEATHALLMGQGGGGAGGGANAGATAASVGAPSSSGGYFEDLILLDQGRLIDLNVGAGGVPVIGGTGGNGQPTTVTYGNRAYTCNGGLGSIASASFSSTLPVVLGCVDGGTSSATIAGVPANSSNAPLLLLVKGGPGVMSWIETISSGIGGNGGDSKKAPGATAPSSGRGGNASADGLSGQFGSGGSGAINFNNAPVAGNAGGPGGTGFVFVWELALSL